MNQVKSLLLFSLILSFVLFGCDSSNQNKNVSGSPRIKSISRIDLPKNGSQKVIGEVVAFEVSSSNADVTVDSIRISNQGKEVSAKSLKWETAGENPGKKSLLVSVYLSNGSVEKKRHSLTLLSDIEPLKYTYKVLNTYVHDPDAFTEGLLIDNGKLYESTGEKGHSSVREVDIKTGKILKSAELSSQYFGEGIGLIDQRIYMLSWKERTGFIFDKNSFEEIGQFTYPTEGWGMTSSGDTLIMSDGTHILRFMDPDGFSEIRQIEVYDQNGPIDLLNEVEFIKGDIFAVRWQTEMVYVIDPKSGKVKGTLDLTGIFNYSNYDRRIDVLNGIAYDHNQDKYYITGKWWPKLFEIQLITANNI